MSKRELTVMSILSVWLGVSAASVHADSADRFAKLDVNADGAVTAQEFEQRAMARFEQTDTNKDGKLSSEEREAHRDARGRERFSERDINRDGVLERSELESMSEAVFSKIDADKSGGLNPKEMRSFDHARHAERAQQAPQPDTDGDGLLSPAEAIAHARAQFAKLDANRDGRLSADEFAARRAERTSDKQTHAR